VFDTSTVLKLKECARYFQRIGPKLKDCARYPCVLALLAPRIADAVPGDAYAQGYWDITNHLEEPLYDQQNTYNTFILVNAQDVTDYFGIPLDGYDKIGLFDKSNNQFIGANYAAWNDPNSSNPVSAQVDAYPRFQGTNSEYFPMLSLANVGGSERVKVDLEITSGDEPTMTWNQWGLLTNKFKTFYVEGIPEPISALPVGVIGGTIIYALIRSGRRKVPRTFF